MAQSALMAAFLAGLLGGLHCIAMCGGYVGVLAAGNRPGQTDEILHVRTLFVRQLIANTGRVVVYTTLGALAGTAGAGILGTEWIVAQRALYAGANVLLLVLAYAMTTGRSPFAAFERAGLAVYKRVLPAAAALGPRPGPIGRLLMGMLWGLTPCGLVYSVLPVALLAGSALDGALVMLLFGVGTLPNLLAAGWVAGRAGGRLQSPRWRMLGGAVVAAFGLLGLYRSVFVPEALAHGPFCLVP